MGWNRRKEIVHVTGITTYGTITKYGRPNPDAINVSCMNTDDKEREMVSASAAAFVTMSPTGRWHWPRSIIIFMW